jgi:hypothetical protein
MCRASTAAPDHFSVQAIDSLPGGDVRVSGRAHTPSWVYRRRAHGPPLEYHQLHGSSTHSQGGWMHGGQSGDVAGEGGQVAGR